MAAVIVGIDRVSGVLDEIFRCCPTQSVPSAHASPESPLPPGAGIVASTQPVFGITRCECTRRGRDQRVHRNPATLVTPIVSKPAAKVYLVTTTGLTLHEDIFPDTFAMDFGRRFESSPKASEQQIAAMTAAMLSGSAA